MSWDNDTIRTAVNVLSFAFAVAAAVYSWWVARNRQTRTELARVSEQVSDVESRVTATEHQLQYVPGQQEVRDLHREIADLRGDMREISGSLTGISRAVDLMNQHLLSHDSTKS